MRSMAPILVAALFSSVLLHRPAALADERIEGLVRDAVVTYCDAMRRGGCAGTLTLERQAHAAIETLTVRVPLGTPISRCSERILLHALEGKRVIVTHVIERGASVARAIQVAEPLGATAASGSSSPEGC